MGLHTTALVDSGASVSLMSKQFFDKTVYASTISHLPPPDFESITGVSGTSLPVMGKFEVNFAINKRRYQYTVHVVEGLHHSFILGVDFMEA